MQGQPARKSICRRNAITTGFDVLLAQEMLQDRCLKIRCACALHVKGQLFTVRVNRNEVGTAEATLWEKNFLFVLNMVTGLAQELCPGPLEGVMAMQAGALCTGGNMGQKEAKRLTTHTARPQWAVIAKSILGIQGESQMALEC